MLEIVHSDSLSYLDIIQKYIYIYIYSELLSALSSSICRIDCAPILSCEGQSQWDMIMSIMTIPASKRICLLDNISLTHNQFSAACSVVAAVLFRAVLRCVQLSLRPNKHSAGHRSKTKHMNGSFVRAKDAKALGDSKWPFCYKLVKQTYVFLTIDITIFKKHRYI